MWRFLITLPLLCSSLPAAGHTRTIPLAGTEVTGFALDGNSLFVWGQDVYRVDLRSGKRERIAQGKFAEGGCLLRAGGAKGPGSGTEFVRPPSSDLAAPRRP